MSSTSTTAKNEEGVWIGPDLNISRSPLDKKLYRQIIIQKNGLRILLVSDTIAMMEEENDDLYEDDDDDLYDEEDSEDDSEEEGEDSDDEEEEEDGIRNAAVAVVVKAGSYDDPKECQGMAHFLEHMLFMGTKEYPDENAYDVFVNTHGGSDNAYTEMEYTLYHLEIPQTYLKKGMNMLSQFFSGTALLRPDAVDREVNAIESEFRLSYQNDSCRQQQLYCHTSSHPEKDMFAWGNLESLIHIPKSKYPQFNVMDSLRAFYQTHYHAQNINVVVMGAYSLDQLQQYVLQSFSCVPPSPNYTHTPNCNPWKTLHQEQLQQEQTKRQCPFHDNENDNNNHSTTESTCKVYRLIPVKDRHLLTITWQLPCQKNIWDSKPCDIIALLLGHESQGSILSYLKSQQWVQACYAGIGNGGLEQASTHALFTMTYTLTQPGVNHWKKIVKYTNLYIGMIRHYLHTHTMPQFIWDDFQTISQCSFDYQEEQSPIDTVEDLAERLGSTFFPPERLLDGPHLLFDYKPQLMQDILDQYLTPQNSRVDIMSSTFKSEEEKAVEVEPYFGTNYWCETVDKETMNDWIQAWEPQLPGVDIHLPPKNPFIPKQFALKELPPNDTHHPLLNCSLKLCISVGKKKSWFPASVLEYNGTKQRILLSYEDEETKWHKLDKYDDKDGGTLDNKTIPFKVVAKPKDGQGAILKYGDGTDYDSFPPIPPALTKSRLPQLIYNTKMLKLWHLQDRKFKRPIAEMRLKIISVNANQSSLNKACAELLTILCSDAATEMSYLASECELNYSLASTDYGFSLRVYGFDDQLLNLLKELLTLFFKFQSSTSLPIQVEDRFDSILESYNRKLTNIGRNASGLCTDIRLSCIRPTLRSAYSKAKAIEDITKEKFCTVASNLLSKVSIEALYHGNVDLMDAKRASDLITSMLTNKNKSKQKSPQVLVTMVPKEEECQTIILPALNPDDPNSAVEQYFQIGKDDIKNRVLIDLLSQILHEPFYDQVRTKDQFGYSVSCEPRWSYGVIGMSFRIITSSKSAMEASDRINQFLIDIRSQLVSMTTDTFMETLVGLAKMKLQMFNSLEEECSHLWSEIIEKRYNWESYRDEVIVLRSLTKNDVLQAFDDWLSPFELESKKKQKRRQLIVQVIGNTSEMESEANNDTNDDTTTLVERRIQVDKAVSNYHQFAKNNTWGKIY